MDEAGIEEGGDGEATCVALVSGSLRTRRGGGDVESVDFVASGRICCLEGDDTELVGDNGGGTGTTAGPATRLRGGG